jgi:tRNA (cytidine/uridine-2'-O-)-methyltransferase
MKIVLFQPDIPQNTGNIGRLCVATQTPLYLVKPLGFTLDDQQIKRSGMDYWQDLDLMVLKDRSDFENSFRNQRIFFFSTKGKRSYTEIQFQPSDILIFGSESRGLPPDLYETQQDRLYTIPMSGPARSLNLATSVGIVLYEALRQTGFSPKNS